tara:strand:- start:18553 stop:19824 length:1272 start_codon:yes stop_codon:yes gene_type:complete
MESYRERVRDLIRESEYGQAFREIRSELESQKSESSVPQKRAWSLYFACISLFGLGHVQQARRYYQELLEVAGDSVSSRYIQAYLELQSRKPEEALVTLTSILELDPSDTRCDALIEQLKEAPDSLAEYSRKRAGILDFFPGIAPEHRAGGETDPHFSSGVQSSGKARDNESSSDRGKGRLNPIGLKSRDGERNEDYYAKPERKGIPTWVIVAISILALGLAAVAGWKMMTSSDDPLMDSDLPRPPGHSTVLPEAAGEFSYFYDSKDRAVEDYEKARLAIEDGRVNQARKMLGRLERSNVDFVFKERAKTLRQSIPLPRMEDFTDSVTMGEIESDPYSYRDAVFLWQGTVETSRLSPTGADLKMRLKERDESVLLRYSGGNSEIMDGLKELEAGHDITVFGRVLSSDEGSNMMFQLLDFRPGR